MPQFNFSTYSSQIFWLLTCFGVFFSYIKFYFIPKLEAILVKRNQEIEETKRLIEQNNRDAQKNFEEADKILRETYALAHKIVSDAKEQARIEQENALKEIQNSQKRAVEKIVAEHKAQLNEELIISTVEECVETVLKQIGFDLKKEDIQKLIK